jgi:hypothetical protein
LTPMYKYLINLTAICIYTHTHHCVKGVTTFGLIFCSQKYLCNGRSLKINLGKLELVPVGAVEDVGGLANILSCRVSSFPMKCLGLPLGVVYREIYLVWYYRKDGPSFGGMEMALSVKEW